MISLDLPEEAPSWHFRPLSSPMLLVFDPGHKVKKGRATAQIRPGVTSESEINESVAPTSLNVKTSLVTSLLNFDDPELCLFRAAPVEVYGLFHGKFDPLPPGKALADLPSNVLASVLQSRTSYTLVSGKERIGHILTDEADIRSIPGLEAVEGLDKIPLCPILTLDLEGIARLKVGFNFGIGRIAGVLHAALSDKFTMKHIFMDSKERTIVDSDDATVATIEARIEKRVNIIYQAILEANRFQRLLLRVDEDNSSVDQIQCSINATIAALSERWEDLYLNHALGVNEGEVERGRLLELYSIEIRLSKLRALLSPDASTPSLPVHRFEELDLDEIKPPPDKSNDIVIIETPLQYKIYLLNQKELDARGNIVILPSALAQENANNEFADFR